MAGYDKKDPRPPVFRHFIRSGSNEPFCSNRGHRIVTTDVFEVVCKECKANLRKALA